MTDKLSNKAAFNSAEQPSETVGIPASGKLISRFNKKKQYSDVISGFLDGDREYSSSVAASHYWLFMNAGGDGLKCADFLRRAALNDVSLLKMDRELTAAEGDRFALLRFYEVARFAKPTAVTRAISNLEDTRRKRSFLPAHNPIRLVGAKYELETAIQKLDEWNDPSNEEKSEGDREVLVDTLMRSVEMLYALGYAGNTNNAIAEIVMQAKQKAGIEITSPSSRVQTVLSGAINENTIVQDIDIPKGLRLSFSLE